MNVETAGMYLVVLEEGTEKLRDLQHRRRDQ